jgi:hypothetical protein
MHSFFSFIERGDAFDWEALVDKEASAKRRINVNEILPGMNKILGLFQCF